MPRWDGKTPEDRFWAKVDKSGGCWVWTGAKFANGYGAVKWQGKQQRAHRVAWEMVHGSVPDGMRVCHHCDNKPCVREPHLFVGTDADNAADCMAKDRTAVGERNGKYTKPEKTPRREKHGRARLTTAKATQIRSLYRFGNGTILARMFGVGSSTIYRVVKGENWV